MKTETPSQSDQLTIIGWSECISLPLLGLHNFAVKVDTGAKTTALHADNIEVFFKGDERWVRFRTPSRLEHPPQTLEMPVHTRRNITNTSGKPERRIVIRTPMVLAGRTWKIDVSLTDRENMTSPLILGRRALRKRHIAVHPGQTYLVSSKPHFEGS